MGTSDADLIEIRHVGVTAKIKSPLRRMLPECSTAESDEPTDLFPNNTNNTTMYSKFTPSDETETTCGGLRSPSTEESKLLYEMQAERKHIYNRRATQHKKSNRKAFTRIEFKLHKTAKRKLRQPKPTYSTPKKTKRLRKTKKPTLTTIVSPKNTTSHDNSLLKRLRSALSQLFSMRSPAVAKQLQDPFSDLERQIKTADVNDNFFYPFERGCSDFMRTTDSPPDLVTDHLAERTNRYATRFWAEFFGILNIGVSLAITFVLQFYRFVLFALVHTLLVGLLRMTADYLLKPLLASLFNGFVQPFFLLFQNIFTSLRDALQPIADALHDFFKPLIDLFGSFRLIDASRSCEKFVKEA